MNEEGRLPDLWWIHGQRYLPQGYTCPLLITLSMWLERLRGRDAYWRRGAMVDGKWLTPARVYVGNREISCHFPRWLILRECAFWNSSLGGRLRAPLIPWSFAE